MEKSEKKQTAGPSGLFQKILAVQKTVKALKKNERAYNYDYVNGDKILSLIRPAMDELGLLLLPEVTSFQTEPVSYQAWDAKAQMTVEKKEILAKIEVLFTWVDTATGERLEQRWAGSGMNAFDKGFGSALTYAERYYLLKVFHIATDRDDVDAIAATRDEAIEKASGTQPATATPAPSPVQTKPEKNTRHVAITDEAFIDQVVIWVLKQKSSEAAIARASIQYDWEKDALEEFCKRARSAVAFRQDLNGNETEEAR